MVIQQHGQKQLNIVTICLGNQNLSKIVDGTCFSTPLYSKLLNKILQQWMLSISNPGRIDQLKLQQQIVIPADSLLRGKHKMLNSINAWAAQQIIPMVFPIIIIQSVIAVETASSHILSNLDRPIRKLTNTNRVIDALEGPSSLLMIMCNQLQGAFI